MPCQWYQVWLGHTRVNGVDRDMYDQTPAVITWAAGYPSGNAGYNFVLKNNGQATGAMLNSWDQKMGVVCQYRPGIC